MPTTNYDNDHDIQYDNIGSAAVRSSVRLVFVAMRLLLRSNRWPDSSISDLGRWHRLSVWLRLPVSG